MQYVVLKILNRAKEMVDFRQDYAPCIISMAVAVKILR